MKSKRKVNTQEELLSCISDAAAHIKKLNINSNDQHTFFKYELQSALQLTVGFFNLCCKLQQICDFCATNVSFKH